MHFLKKHRFSAVMVGNSQFQGKSGNFYIQMKKNQENLINQTNPIIEELDNSESKEKLNTKNNDTNVGGAIINDTYNDNNFFNNDSIQETESKIIY